MMTFFIDLDYRILNADGSTLEKGNIDWWSNQVPESGDRVLINSQTLDIPVELNVISRTWSLLRQTGGGSTGHDVTITARATP